MRSCRFSRARKRWLSFFAWNSLGVLAAAASPRVDGLVRRMTLAEKADQLHQAPIGRTDPNNLSRNHDTRADYGSYLFNQGCARGDVQGALRRLAAGSRLRIPPIFGADVIH